MSDGVEGASAAVPAVEQTPITIRALIVAARSETAIFRFVHKIHISRKFGYVYVNNAKVGCSSIKRSLFLAEAPNSVNLLQGDKERVHHRVFSPLVTLAHVMDGDFKRNSREIFSFSFVRNPYTRVLSCYRDKILGDQPHKMDVLKTLGREAEGISARVSFREFVEAIVSEDDPNQMDVHWTPQDHQLGIERFAYSAIGRFERFDEDFRRIKQAIGFPERLTTAEIRANRTRRLSDDDGLTDDIAALIHARYRGDFERFGYDPDPARRHEPPEAERASGAPGYLAPPYFS